MNQSFSIFIEGFDPWFTFFLPFHFLHSSEWFPYASRGPIQPPSYPIYLIFKPNHFLPNHFLGVETMQLRLGLEPTCWDSSPAKTQIGTWTHGLLTEITHLVSGLNEAQVLNVSSQKEFSERQSDKEEVDLFREKRTPQTQCGPSQKARAAPGYGVVSFYKGG